MHSWLHPGQKNEKVSVFIVYCSFEFPQPLSYSGYEIY